MRNILYLFIFLGMQWMYACNPGVREEAQKEETLSDQVTLSPEQMRQAGVETAAIGRHILHEELRVNGLVDVPPQNIVSISFPLGGYLKSTQLLPGMQVKRGEVIGIMEDQALVQLQQDYLMAMARLEYLEKERERQRLLSESQVNAEKTYQQAVAEHQSQRILVKGLSEKLRLIRITPEKLSEQNISREVPIYSPINGFVSKVNVNIGKYVQATDVLFELINPDDMHAALTVFEKDIAKVKPGQQVLVSFVDEPGTDYPCEVLLVTRNVDENRSALVHCHFDKQPKHLLPGMFLNARIGVSQAERTAVPEAAIVRYGQEQFLLEVTGENRFSLLPVKTGISEGGLTEVSSPAGDLYGRNVIVKNPYPVLSALKNTAEE